MKRVFPLLVLSSVLLIPATASASLIVAATIGGQNFCATDNNTPCSFGTQITDTNLALNTIDLAPQNLGGIDFIGSAQIAQFGPAQNILNAAFLQATNSTGATITGSVAISATGFIPPVSQAFTSGSATFQNAVGSTSTLGWYNDPTNSQGAETALDRPGLLLDTFSYTVTSIADSFAHTTSNIPVFDPNLFSMTLSTDFTIVAGGQVTNRGQTELKPIDTVVPEPASLILLGSGLLFVARKRKIS